jgi:GAF domain-containing protein
MAGRGTGEVLSRLVALAPHIFGVRIAALDLADQDVRLLCDDEVDPQVVGRLVATRPWMLEEMTVIEDAWRDADCRLSATLARLGLRFYAGAPVVSRGGRRLGTVGLMDLAPRALTEAQVALLEDLATLLGRELERRRDAPAA